MIMYKKSVYTYIVPQAFNPLTAGAEYIRFFVFLLPHYVPHFYPDDIARLWHSDLHF